MKINHGTGSPITIETAARHAGTSDRSAIWSEIARAIATEHRISPRSIADMVVGETPNRSRSSPCRIGGIHRNRSARIACPCRVFLWSIIGNPSGIGWNLSTKYRKPVDGATEIR